VRRLPQEAEMSKSPNQKLRILYLLKMLMQETDDRHGMTMPEIIDRLDEEGILAERRAVYDDIKLLREFGVDIIARKSRTTDYFIGSRDFEFQELTLLIDAVQSSKFLTEKKSRELIRKLSALVSVHEAASLNHGVHVAGRIKMQNESIYYILNDIQYAISKGYKIAFKYYDYDLDKKRVARRDGKSYLSNPVRLTYADDNYYLITYNNRYDEFVTYRVDRMMNVNILNEPSDRMPAGKKLDLAEFCNKAFGMFSGRDTRVMLAFHASVMNQIVDRFGKDVLVQKTGADTAVIHVPVSVSRTFFGWLTQFSGSVWIESPDELIEEYTSYLEQLIQNYNSAPGS
jgi:predicted DNA-binding transcriptional regulator YafY